jgi:hypothetical protein
MEYGEPALPQTLQKKPGNPYTKKAPRQTAKRITSVERGGSGLAAGFFYTWITGNLLTQSAWVDRFF